jgi:Tfp pilus assembly protein PilX
VIKGCGFLRAKASGEEGYVLIVVMLVLIVIGMMATTLIAGVVVNQQHVGRDRAYTESLGVAEAGLNRYLWMVASGQSCEANDFAIPGVTEGDVHTQTASLADSGGKVTGTYTMQVDKPGTANAQGVISSLLTVTVTGRSVSPVDVPRTVIATIGRPSFSQYVLLTDGPVLIGGPETRQWWGKTHSNTQIEINTYNINDIISCSNSTYDGDNGVFSTISAVRNNANSLLLWKFPVPEVDFSTVTADFARYRDMALGAGSSYAYVTPSPSTAQHGWYIRLGSDNTYQVAQVTAELEQYNYVSGLNRGGYLTYKYNNGAVGSLSPPIAYPANGIIFVNDNVWVEGTGVTKRITVAASGQFNGTGKTASVNIVGDLTYATLDGKAAIGLIGEQDIKIPMYAPMGKAGTMGTDEAHPGTVDMTVHAAVIAQTGREYVNRSDTSGPRRRLLTIIGSISSFLTPSRATTNGTQYGGFAQGANDYDSFLLYNPPPSFPTVGSYQILEWQELPSTMGVGGS